MALSLQWESRNFLFLFLFLTDLLQWTRIAFAALFTIKITTPFTFEVSLTGTQMLFSIITGNQSQYCLYWVLIIWHFTYNSLMNRNIEAWEWTSFIPILNDPYFHKDGLAFLVPPGGQELGRGLCRNCHALWCLCPDSSPNYSLRFLFFLLPFD